MPKYTNQDKLEAAATLHRLLKPGDTVYTILRSHSRSGTRVIDPKVITRHGPYHIQWAVAVLTGKRISRDKNGIVMGGTGYDADQEIVYDLGRALWPNGFRVRKSMQCGSLKPGQTCKDGGLALVYRRL